MDKYVLPAKRVADRITLSIDFSSIFNGVFTSSSVSVEVYSGEDFNAQAILVGNSTVDGNVVNQKIQKGLPGVVYLLTFSGINSAGEVYILEALQAIIPYEDTVTPSYVAKYFTTWPYNIIWIDGLSVNSLLTSGIGINYPAEEIAVSVALLGGSLNDPLLFYTNWPPEELKIATELLSGTIVSVLLFYTNWPPEELKIATELLGGTLVVVLLFYTNWPPEELKVSATLLGGTLV